MSRDTAGRVRRPSFRHLLRHARKPARPGFERLEARLMMASDLPPALVVGRTPSVWSVADVQDRQVSLTYTVYNEQASPLDGVLLTTELAPGISLVDATIQPDRDGQRLAWSLGTVEPFERTSVTVTITLTDPTPLQLDTGARAFATLDAGLVSDDAPPAALRPDPVPAAWLASTPDANGSDPFIQEKAAALDYDPQAIFDYLHNEVGYNAYVGSLRGARGTLWSAAGNSVDVASLGVALMRASGIPAQYQQGSLPVNLTQQLILSMFPPSFQTVGWIPPGTPTANPLNDFTLYTDSQQFHTWFQFDTGDGQGMRDADPLIASATIGQAFTTSQQTFTEVPDEQRHKTQITLTAETYSQIGALFGVGNGLSATTVLDETFNTVDLVGHPVTVGNYLNSSAVGFVLAAQTNTYTPYLEIAGDTFTQDDDTIITGQPYQEVLTNFPLGSSVVTALFIDITLTDPTGGSQSFESVMADRIGVAARGGFGGSVQVDPQGPPLLTPYTLTTLDISAATQAPNLLQRMDIGLEPLRQELQAHLAAPPAAPPDSISDPFVVAELIASSRLTIAQYRTLSDSTTALLARNLRVAAYADAPRITIVKFGVDPSGPTPVFTEAVDLRRNDLRVVAAPGQSLAAVYSFQTTRGGVDTFFETAVLSRTEDEGGTHVAPPVSADTIVARAQTDNIPLVALMPGDTAQLDGLQVTDGARALVTQALADGNLVIIPSRAVTINGRSRSAWYQTNLTTGETIGVLDDGGHQAITEQTPALLLGVKIGFLAGLVPGLISFPLGKVHPALGFGASAYGGLSGIVGNVGRFAPGTLGFFFIGFSLGFFIGTLLSTAITGALRIDPPLPDALLGPDWQLPPVPEGFSPVAVPASRGSGSVSGTYSASAVAASGQLIASWTGPSAAGFRVQSLSVTGATVRDGNGIVVGSGAVSLALAAPVAAEVLGNNQYTVTGAGKLSFYGAAEPFLGVSGEWQNYTATVMGSPSITLTTDGLLLNSQSLPAGRYTITAPSATLSGSGATSSPNFAGTVAITATNGTITLGPGTGSLSLGGDALDTSNETTLTGYAGTIQVTANSNGTDSVSLNGSAANALTVTTSPASPTTDQNTPITIQTSVQTSFADTYTITATAPNGWTVTVDDSGRVVVTPAPGLQSGTFPVRIIARSQANPNLVAQTVVQVTISPTQPGLTFRVDHDPIFTVPFNGAQIPSAFQALIRNTGPTAETFNLTFSNVPAGFSVVGSRTSVTIPAGETGIIGVYLQPNAGQPLPPPGTQLSFTVTARSIADASVTQSETETFTVPEIQGVTITSSPPASSTTPGVPVTVEITMRAVGNVPESFTPTFTTTSGLMLTGLAPVSLQPGQSVTQVVTLTPDPSVLLNTTLQAVIQAPFGPTDPSLIPTLTLPLRVVAPGADAIASASVAARQLDNPALANRFNDLAIALTNLVQDPSNPVFKSQAIASIDSLISQLMSDPFLSEFTGGLTAGRGNIAAATSASEVQEAVTTLGDALDDLAGVITDVARHGFTIGLGPNRQIVQPDAPLVFSIPLTNNGSVATTYILSVSSLPAGVTAEFSQSSVTLQPGQSLIAGSTAPTVTLRETGATLAALSFTVTATAEAAPEITRSVSGELRLRDESVVVAGIVTDPPFTDAGGQVNVSARILGVVNRPTAITASFTVNDPAGNPVFSSTPADVALDARSGLLTVDLGTIDTTGFANGAHTITVSLSTGGSATTTLLIGQPVSVTHTATPAVVPTGSETVTSTITVSAHASFPEPLTLLGAAVTAAPGTSVAVFQVGASLYAYESGTGGIDAFDVTDPANPQHLRTFGQGDIVSGQFGFNIARVVNDKLVIATTTSLNANGFTLLVYDLADPTNPQLVSSKAIAHRFLSDLLVNSTNTAAFVPTNGVSFFGFPVGNIFNVFGDFSAIDLSNLADPVLASTLFNNQGPLDGGDMRQFGGTLVNDQIAYSVGLAPGGGTVIGNHGNLLVVDISNVNQIQLIHQVAIPGTIAALGVAVDGNRALVVGSAGTETTRIDFNATGLDPNTHLSLTVLDITDPLNPVVLGSTLVTSHQFPLNEPGAKVDVVALGNGGFAISGTAANGEPALAVVDARDPENIVIGAGQVPSFVHGITVAGDKLYATTASGLSIYQIEELVSSPVTISVDLPAGTAANILDGSFNSPPSQVITSDAGDRLVWNRSFAAGNTTFTFTWQTRVSDVAAGQVVPVTTGATVDFDDQGTPGSVSVPGTAVTGASIITVSPATQTVQPGGSVSYNVRLSNPTDFPVTYFLSSTQSTITGQVVLPFSVQVAPQSALDVPLNFSASFFAQPGDNTITVHASFLRRSADGRTVLGEYSGSATTTATVAGSPVAQADPVAHGVVAQLFPGQATVGAGGEARYVVRVTNTGSETDFFELAVNGLPDGAAADLENSFLEVPPGARNFRELTLIVRNFGADPGSHPFTVSAVVSGRENISSTADAILNVVSHGVDVALDPATGLPGGVFNLRVTNAGTVADTFDLALGGPAALVASLATTQVTLEPGASQVIPISTTGVNFALPGALDLLAMATSRSEPAVRDAATAGLTISATSGLAARFNPAEQVLPAPGLATFVLLVSNTGNVEDEYTATITGTSGPLTARLVGLDGQLTRTISSFRLPALGTGALTLQVDLAAAGQGTVTVQVRSLNDSTRTATATATVTAGQAAVATITQLNVAPNPAAIGQLVTLTAIVTAAGGGLPAGTVTFTIDGVPQPPVDLVVIDGAARAVLTTSALAEGLHTITAAYGGAPGLLASVSDPATLVVSAVPVVTAVQRFGIHAQPTRIVVSFNEDVDPAGAVNLVNYRLVGPGRDGRFGTADDRVIRLRGVTYDPGTRSVTIRPRVRLPLRHRFRLTIRDTETPGLTDLSGNRLDGDGNGLPGGPFTTTIDRSRLVLGARSPRAALRPFHRRGAASRRPW